jgi:hypothetical protein
MPEQEFYWSPVPASPIKHPCACCGYQTLREPPPATWETCLVCLWEDEPGTLEDLDYVGGGDPDQPQAGEEESPSLRSL